MSDSNPSEVIPSIVGTPDAGQITSFLKKRIDGLRQDVRSPLYRNAYALMLNTGLTSVLGFGYWALAASIYGVEAVGAGAAVVTAMMLISVLSQFSFVQVLIRFTARAGSQTKKLVLGTYAIAAGISALVATAAAGAFAAFGSGSENINLTLASGIWFVVATGTWSIFNLQDGALTGLRRTPWIPLENGIFGIVKIALLVAFEPVFGTNGIFLSWTIPVVISVLPINYLIFRKFIPAHVTANADKEQKIERKQVLKFVVGEYPGSLSVQLATTLMPILVIAVLGSVSNGYFYMAQIIATGLDLVAISLAASLTVEASNHEDKIRQLTRAVLGRTLKLIVPAALVIFAFAPLILGFLDPAYSDNSTTLLRLLILASIPKAVTSVYGSLCRVQHKTHRNGIIQFVQVGLLIGLSLALMPHIGIEGVGIAALVGQLAIAIFVIPSLFGSIRRVLPETPDGMTSTIESIQTPNTLMQTSIISANGELIPETLQPTLTETEEEPPRPGRKATLLGILTPIILLVAGLWLVKNADAHNSGLFGLIEAIPKSYFAVVGLLTISFVLQLRAGARAVVLIAHLITAIFMLHGIAGYIEDSPRFSTAFVHVGFIDYIIQHDAAQPNLDARMSWPAFFAMGALLTEVAGVPDSIPFLLWASAIINVMYLPLVWSIARSASADRRVPWLATMLFVCVSWVGQDYFAPQALNYLIFLTFLAVVLRMFRNDNGRLPGVLHRMAAFVTEAARWVLRLPVLRPGLAPAIESSPNQRALIVAAMLVLYAAAVVSHQLTPMFLLMTVGLLALAHRTQLLGLPLLMIVMVFTWISYGAIGYWSGHLDSVFGGLGQVSGILKQNVEARTDVVTNDHVFVIYGRLALSAFIWGAAAFGAFRRWRKGRSDLPLIICFFAQFLILGGQSYGGEAILRVFFFTLPFAATLAVLGLLPTQTRMTLFKTVLTCAVFVALIPAFFFTRYGNEQFEFISKDELKATQEMFRIAPEGSTLVVFDANTPLGLHTRDNWDFQYFEYKASADEIFQQLNKSRNNAYVLITRAQVEATETNVGAPHGWEKDKAKDLIDSGKFKVIYENKDGQVFEAVK